jgi:agmatinase
MLVRAGRARPRDVEDTLAAGNVIMTAREVREKGVSQVLDLLQRRDATRSSSTATVGPFGRAGHERPLPGGLSYLDAAALFAGLAGRGQVVGMNVAEHYPSLDVNGITSLVIARLIAIWNGSLRLPVVGGAATLRSGQR